MQSTSPRLSCLALALFTLANGAQAQAPTPPAEAAPQLPDVTVTDTLPTADPSEGRPSYKAQRSSTATGLALKPRETPQAISTITHSQLQDFRLTSVNDALAMAPGVTVEKVETDRTYYASRGLDIDNFQLDGIGMPFTNGAQWGDLDTVIYDRIDVLRGANGLMTGTGQPSATVNFVRKKPTAKFQSSAELTLGSWNLKRAQADVSGALNADASVRARLVGAVEDKDSYLDRYGRARQTLYGVVDMDLGEATMLSLGLLTQETRARSPLWGALPMNYTDGSQTNYDASTSTAADWAWWNNRDQRVHAELQHAFTNGWDLRTVLTHREMNTDSELLYLYGTPDRDTGQGLFIYPSAFAGHYVQDMLNVQASGPYSLAGRQHELTLGASWAHEDAWEQSGYSSITGQPLGFSLSNWNGQITKPAFNASYNGSDFRTNSMAVYGGTRLNLSDTFKLLAGGRFTHISSQGQNYGSDHTYSHSQTTPYIGAVWDLGANVSLYGSATRIFKPQTELDAQHQVLAPIQGRNTELGIKADLLNKALAAQLAVFDTRQNGLAGNASYVAPSGSQPGYTAYEGVDTRSRGIELELTGQAHERLEITSSITHLSLQTADGQQARTFVPRDTVRVGLRYKPTDRLSTTASLRWQSAIYSSSNGAVARQAAYALLDVGASYALSPHWKASAQIRNLGNQKYLNSLYWDQAYYGAPRHGEVSLSWTF